MAGPPPAFVVDASVTAAWFLPDESTGLTETALHATVASDVWVPALWVLEMSNLLLNAQRRRRISAEKRRELATAASTLRIKVDREAVGLLTLDSIATDHRLSAYDAAYLELALRRGLPLLTQDVELIAAMRKAGVPTVSVEQDR